VFNQYYVTTEWVIPYLFELTGIHATWLTTVILAFYTVMGAMVCVAVSGIAIIILHSLLKKKHF